MSSSTAPGSEKTDSEKTLTPQSTLPSTSSSSNSTKSGTTGGRKSYRKSSSRSRAASSTTGSEARARGNSTAHQPHEHTHDEHTHDHTHEPERHHDHYHAHPHTHHHTVIHAIRSKHPPHHHHEHRTRKHLIARPRARQYFTHDGDLHKQCDDGIPRQAGKFELFLDLLYIGLVATFAEDVIQHPSSVEHFWKYILIFIPAWRIWSDLTSLMNMYYNDDILQRVLIVWVMLLMLLYGNNATSIDTSLTALQITTGSFIVARISIIAIKFLYSFTVFHHRFQLRVHALGSLLTLPLWTPLFLESVSTKMKIGFAVLAFGSDQLAVAVSTNRWFTKAFGLKYTTALDIDHHIERMTAFYIIVLGEFLYGLVWEHPAALDPVGSKFGRAAMALVIAFCLCWLYISCDGSRDNPETGVHAIRWKAVHAVQWFVLHLPLSMALLVAGDICAVFVRAGELGVGVIHETEDQVSVEAGGTHEKREEAGEFPRPEDWNGLRWMLCGGLAVGVLCMYWICMLHHESDEDEHTRCHLLIPKKLRRFVRLPVAIIIACLPLASPETLSITSLLAIVMSLLSITVLWEMVGSLDARSWTVLENGPEFCEEEDVVVVDDEKIAAHEEEGRVVVERFEHRHNLTTDQEEDIIERCSIEGCTMKSDIKQFDMERRGTDAGLERVRTSTYPCTIAGCTEALERRCSCDGQCED